MTLDKRQLRLIGIIVLLFATAFGLQSYFTQHRNLQRYANKISTHLQDQTREVDHLLSDTAFVTRQFTAPEKVEPAALLAKDLEIIDALTIKPFNICFYDKEQLVFWTNNQVFPDKFLLRKFNKSSGALDYLVSLDNGYYALQKYTFDYLDNDKYAIVLIPVKREYSLQSDYLINSFTHESNIPSEINIAKAKTKYPIINISGTELGYIDSEGNFKDIGQQLVLLAIYLLAFLFLGILINDISIKLARQKKPAYGALFLLLTVFAIRYFSVIFDFSSGFRDLHIFTNTFNTDALYSSLGDLLINSALILWMMVFFHREFAIESPPQTSKLVKYGSSIFIYFSILLGFSMMTGVFKHLVIFSDISFDFDNVFNLNVYSFFAILGIIMLLFALFLFTHRMMLTIKQIDLLYKNKILSSIIAWLCVLPFFFVLDLGISVLFYFLSCMVFIYLFDMFVDNKSTNLTWSVFWLFLFSAYSASLLFKYNADKDKSTRVTYAKNLAILEDSLAERELSMFKYELSEIMQFAKGNDVETIDKMMGDEFSKYKYLYNNYPYEYVGYYDENEQLQLVDTSYHSKFSYSKPTNDIQFIKGEEEDYAYIMQVTPNDSPETTLLFEFERRRRNASRVYTELLLDTPYKMLSKIDNYSYAIYRNGILTEKNEEGFSQIFDVNEAMLPEPGQYTEIVATSERSDILYRSINNDYVVIGKDLGGYLKPISLFSYIFGLLIFLVLTLAGMNSIFRTIPSGLDFAFPEQTSLKNRIQYWVISLFIFSFVVIGIATVWYFRKTSIQYHEDRLERKMAAVEKDAKHELSLLRDSSDDFILNSMVEPISRIHKMDVNIYDLNGDLVNSSEADIFKKGVMAPKMGARARHSILRLNKSSDVQDEAVGNLGYKAAYIPLTRVTGETIAYLGLPYYSKQRKLRSDVTPFMGTLLNVYIFLLIIAGVIAILVSNSITRPLTNLGEGLKRLRLGGSNELLEWETKDELGELIIQFNNMQQRLAANADKLAQSERDSAWREMAKQVAHEIKNPLTPMKLSIQYLKHAFQADPDNAKPMVERVSLTLIEQIDNLARIANEFSNFAKMPPPQNSEFSINQLTKNVHYLFENEGADMDLHKR